MKSDTRTAPKFHLIEGRVTEFVFNETLTDLIGEFGSHTRDKSSVAATIASLLGLHGVAAVSSLVAMHEREETQVFFCKVAGMVLYGEFAGAELLQNGDLIRAAVERDEHGLLRVEAVINETKGFMLARSSDGIHKQKRRHWLTLISCGALTWILGVVGIGINGMTAVKKDLLVMTLILSIVIGSMGLWTGKRWWAPAYRTTEAFRVLGFQDPERVTLHSYQMLWSMYDTEQAEEMVKFAGNRLLSSPQCRDAYFYRLAVRDGAIVLKERSA